jgi:hemerythrin-like domain-containing protein
MGILCVEHLLRDHREGEKIMAELRALLDEPTDGPCWSAARAEAFARMVRFFDAVVLAHLQKEEQILFPALEAFLPREVGPLAVLRGEHHDLLAQFAEMRQAGQILSEGSTEPRVCQQFERASRALIRLFYDHVYKEDRVLFPMVARLLGPERDAYLHSQMQALEAGNR